MNVTTEAKVSEPIADLEADSPIEQFPQGPRLVGTRCNDCGTSMLGNRIVCSSCVSTDVARIALPELGNLYSFTRLHVGSGPVRAMGYVDLEGVEVRTLAELREQETPLQPDLPVRLVVDGDSWHFAPSSIN